MDTIIVLAKDLIVLNLVITAVGLWFGFYFVAIPSVVSKLPSIEWKQ